MPTPSVYIHTIGCQMNVYDSGQMAAALHTRGYRSVDTPEEADLIVVNTCAVRGKAEQKAFSFLGRLAKLKRSRPSLRVAVSGCVAQQQGRRLLDRMPFVDLVVGTQASARMVRLVERLKDSGGPVVDVGLTADPQQAVFPGRPVRDLSVSRFVTIMQGCDNFCSYCIVPHVRGREMSRPPEEIIAEVEALVGDGTREITLLGQNVNSYGRKEGLCSFPKLLERIDRISGLLRFRFTTSHPKDLSLELMAAFRSLNKLCSHIHLPVQSGSDRVLEAMNRGYTRQVYLEKVDRLRHIQPEIAITSDFIVGFPGESGADFEQTLDLVRRVRFDGIFAFKYSDRPGTAATRFTPKVDEAVRRRRLGELLDLQARITLERNRRLVGCRRQVLVERENRRRYGEPPPGQANPPEWTGRTADNRIVHFAVISTARNAAAVAPGDMVTVRIERALAHSLWGRVVAGTAEKHGATGGESHAA